MYINSHVNNSLKYSFINNFFYLVLPQLLEDLHSFTHEVSINKSSEMLPAEVTAAIYIEAELKLCGL